MTKKIFHHIKSLMKKSTKNMFFTRDFLHEHISSKLASVGKHTYGNITVFGKESTLTVGNYSSIAVGCTVFCGYEHLPERVTTYPFCAISAMGFSQGDWGASHIAGHPQSKGPVVIGNDVWIGHNVTILSGVTIGDGAVIGAEALVARNIPPYAVVGGNPAQIIRYRFDQEIIAALLKIAWWNWDESKVRDAIPLLLDANINRFIKKYLPSDGAKGPPTDTHSV